MKMLNAIIGRISKILKSQKNIKPTYGYRGRYSSWEEAERNSIGYGAPSIAKKVAKAVSTVIANEVAYERDSITFQEPEYSWPVATALLWAASYKKNKLEVLDFGGGLGTSFFQNKALLAFVDRLEWHIVEQASFVQEGRRLFQNGLLSFHANIEECLSVAKPDIAILSSSLQYIPRPYEVLEKITEASIDVVVFDRTLFGSQADDVITIQYVSPEVFDAVIPVWILNETRFLEFMQDKYRVFARFGAYKSTAYLDTEGLDFDEMGFVMILKGSPYEQVLSGHNK